MRVRLIGVSLVGGLLCTLLDQLHVRTGTLSYPRPDVLGQPWWVWPLFTGATFVSLVGYPVGARIAGDLRDLAPRRDAWGTRELIASMIWFVTVYALSGLLNAHPWALTVLFLGTFMARAMADGSRALWLNALALAAGGTLVESLLCHLGRFHYDIPGTYGPVVVPPWLPGIYLHATFTVRAGLRRGLVDDGIDSPGARGVTT